ncbi:CBS and ACT domain-containing protein [Desulforhopalus singaporensis]|uniref:Acetoin utilization protein AcuB n=1 Tax=Desulforhopalus singaporensis TaxID=91360 RepID=A0A1H0IZP1_9BACT|nr:CBS and ACT domain-containing protein [Desulforhopalus singaporensis]SDO36906.1 acetoin utilization protein AcuB [Desulforhopalus singaporensis]
MYIGRIMRTNLITISPDTSLVDARNLLEEKKIDHLLVVDRNQKLVGIVANRDIKQYWASPATSLSTHELNYLLQKVTASMVMIKTVVTVPTSTTIERAAFIMQQHRIGSLPVMEGDKLAGIITSTDVMSVLLKAIGISDDSLRLGLFVVDSLGQLAQVSATLRDAGVNILSLFCWPEEDYPGITQLLIRVGSADGTKAVDALTAKGFKVKTQYEKDITPYLPTT